MTTVDSAGALLGGRYRLLSQAGAGGMAEVWRAEALGACGFSRTVAIKRVLPHLLDDQQFRQMFIEEARVTAALDHPNVVQVFDFGEDEVGLFLAMEWVEGMTLRELSSLYAAHGIQPSAALMAAIVIEVLRALEAAHSRRIVADGRIVPSPIIHRDISPANVMLSVRGVVKLADFGLARALDGARLTPADVLKGKLVYLAPEQLRGAPAEARTDLYTCGLMLWELISGRRLFPGMTDADVARFLLARSAHPSLQSVRPDVPEALCAVVDRAIQPVPELRYQTAADFARALSDVLRDIPEWTDTTRLVECVAHAFTLRPNDRDSSAEYLDADFLVSASASVELLYSAMARTATSDDAPISARAARRNARPRNRKTG